MYRCNDNATISFSLHFCCNENYQISDYDATKMKSPLTYSPLIQDKGGAKQELSNTVFAPKQGFL